MAALLTRKEAVQVNWRKSLTGAVGATGIFYEYFWALGYRVGMDWLSVALFYAAAFACFVAVFEGLSLE